MLDAPQVSPAAAAKAAGHCSDPVTAPLPRTAWHGLRLFGAGRRVGEFDGGIERPGHDQF